MGIARISSNMYTNTANELKNKISDKSFEKTLEEVAKSGNKEKLKETCQEFEAIFLNMMLGTMRKTVPDGGLIEKSHATSTFETMLDEEYSKVMSKSGGFGLGDLLYKQLAAKYINENENNNEISNINQKG